MIRQFDATVRGGRVVLPDGVDLSSVPDGARVRVTVEPPDPAAPAGPPDPGRVRQVPTPALTAAGRAKLAALRAASSGSPGAAG